MPDLEMLLRDVRARPRRPTGRRSSTRRSPPGFPGPVPALEEEAAHAARPLRRALAGRGDRRRGVPRRDRDRQERRDGRRRLRLLERRWRRHVDVGQLRELDSAPEAAKQAGSARAPRRPDSAAGAAPQAADRAVIANASLTLTTSADDVEAVTDRAIRLTDKLGGYVQSSTTSREGSRATATLTLKLPSDKLDEGIAQISKLAHVQSRSQHTEDVTDQRATLEAAVRDARADRAGLRVRLSKATTDKERSRLRAQLDRASRRVTQRERQVA